MGLIALLIALVLGAAGVANLLAPTAGIPADELPLKEQQRAIEEKARACEVEIREKQLLKKRLLALTERMRQVDEELYGARIRRIAAGIDLLDRQMAVEHELLSEYARAHDILEVELETWRVAGNLEGGVLDEITDRLQELEAIRESNRDLELLLEANEDVERLLRGE